MGRVQKAFNYISSFFSAPLPRGTAEFETFSQSIIDIYNLPDLPSYRHAIASMIMHLPPTCHRASKRYFAKCVLKAMANEISYAKIQEYKEAMKKAEEAGETLEPGREH